MRNSRRLYNSNYLPEESNRSVSRTLTLEDALDVIKNYECKVEELRRYSECHTLVDKRIVDSIFGWSVECPETESRQILKELSSKVKQLIKENNLLRSNESIFHLVQENDRLKSLLGEVEMGEHHRESILLEENNYLRAYIEKQNGSKEPITAESVKYERYEEEKNGLEERELHKRIKEIKEEYEGRMGRQQKLIDVLKLRLEDLEDRFKHKLEHRQFEKTVNGQSTFNRRSKVLESSPQMKGDVSVEEEDKTREKHSVRRKLFTPFSESRSREYEKEYSWKAEKEELEKLVELNEKKSIAQNEIIEQLEKELKEISLLNKNHKFNNEINLQSNNGDQEKIKEELKKYKEELYICKQNLIAAKRELIEEKEKMSKQIILIKESFEACELTRIDEMQKEIEEIIDEKNLIERRAKQLTVEQNITFEKELRKERERNNVLKDTCENYEKKLTRLENKIEELEKEIEEKQARDLAYEIDSNTGNIESKSYNVMKWQKKIILNVENSIQKLNKMEKDIEK